MSAQWKLSIVPQIVEVPCQQIRAGDNDRKTFTTADLHELAAQIAEHGLIQPITVRPSGHRCTDDTCGFEFFIEQPICPVCGSSEPLVLYQIVAGERLARQDCRLNREADELKNAALYWVQGGRDWLPPDYAKDVHAGAKGATLEDWWNDVNTSSDPSPWREDAMKYVPPKREEPVGKQLSMLPE
jgi:hypothetical protein